MGGHNPEATPNDFVFSSQEAEIGRLIYVKRHTTPPGIPPEATVIYILELVSLPTGYVYAMYLSTDHFPGSDPLKITDEQLAEKLRSVNGQLDYYGIPVFYHENLGA